VKRHFVAKAKLTCLVAVMTWWAAVLPGAAQDASEIFSEKCASCHTIGKGPMVGPDLAGVKLQPEAQIEASVKRMENQAGSLEAGEINALVQYLKSGGTPALPATATSTSADTEKPAAAKTSDNKGKIEPSTTQQAAQRPVSIKAAEPGSVSVGEELFSGKRTLKNQGMACATCHSVTGASSGGLGPDLSAIGIKINTSQLVVASEKTPYRVMKNAYKANPVTHEEAVDLAAYMSTLKGTATRRPIQVELIGFIGAAILIGAVAFGYRNRNKSARDKLTRR
jgi:mono/diheme cytochrome c family protein